MGSSEPILIIGASRSGTSLLARILASSGIFMGADVESNHESRSIQAANRWVYLNANVGFNDPGAGIEALWADPFLRPAVVQVLAQHVRGRRARRFWGRRRPGGAWGFKDPRATFTLPFWLEVLPDARVIHIQRDGDAVATSLVARRQRVEARWAAGAVDGVALVRQGRPIGNLFAASVAASRAHGARYRAEAARQVAQLGPQRGCTVEYGALLADPGAELARLGAFLGHPLLPWRRRETPDAGAQLEACG